jgi:signal transduction histidine kinase
VESALDELRSLIFELRPPALEADGLVGSVRKHADLLSRAHGLAISVRASEDDVAPGPELERQLFRVIQEALSNVVRHASAGTASVSVEVTPEAAAVVVEDDGVGFDPEGRAIASRRLGLTSMRERVAALGGELEVVSSPGKGTKVRARVPRG